MTDLPKEPPAPKVLLWVSILGSAASIVALVIVLFQVAATRADLPEQFMVWRFFLASAALVGCGAVAVLAYGYCRDVQASSNGFGSKTRKISIALALALILEAVFLDGFFAALLWTPWMWPVWGPILRLLGF